MNYVYSIADGKIFAQFLNPILDDTAIKFSSFNSLKRKFLSGIQAPVDSKQVEIVCGSNSTYIALAAPMAKEAVPSDTEIEDTMTVIEWLND
jgi:hypothetical protein